MTAIRVQVRPTAGSVDGVFFNNKSQVVRTNYRGGSVYRFPAVSVKFNESFDGGIDFFISSFRRASTSRLCQTV